MHRARVLSDAFGARDPGVRAKVDAELRTQPNGAMAEHITTIATTSLDGPFASGTGQYMFTHFNEDGLIMHTVANGLEAGMTYVGHPMRNEMLGCLTPEAAATIFDQNTTQRVEGVLECGLNKIVGAKSWLMYKDDDDNMCNKTIEDAVLRNDLQRPIYMPLAKNEKELLSMIQNPLKTMQNIHTHPLAMLHIFDMAVRKPADEAMAAAASADDVVCMGEKPWDRVAQAFVSPYPELESEFVTPEPEHLDMFVVGIMRWIPSAPAGPSNAQGARASGSKRATPSPPPKDEGTYKPITLGMLAAVWGSIAYDMFDQSGISAVTAFRQ